MTDVPCLVVVFELERRPRIIGAGRLSEAELVRCVDWITSHGLEGMNFDAWLTRYLANRRLRATIAALEERGRAA
jgi:hypothetical protein